MCTLIVLNDHVDGYPLIVAVNRDERYDRPSSPPVVVEAGARSLIRPWDHERDGTWIGVGHRGWFVGMTNQDDGRHDERLLSRGKVIDACLEMGDHRSAARLLAHLDPTLYNPFNVVFGRPGAMFLSSVCPGLGLEMRPLEQGVHVVSNDCCGSLYQQKVSHAHAMLGEIDRNDGRDTLLDKLFRLLGDHTNMSDDDPFQSLCVHGDHHAFGTRSTSIVTVSNQGDVEYWYSEGPPCENSGLTLVGCLSHEADDGDG